jgi:serine protease Do
MNILVLFTVLIVGLMNPVWADGFDPGKIYQETSPAVVLITAMDPGHHFKNAGTGSIIGEGGLFVTTAHVILNREHGRPYRNLWVYLKPKRLTGDLGQDTALRYKAVLINYSKPLDLAVLKISRAGSLKGISPLPLADSDHTGIGERVVAIGHPEQGGLWTLTTGTISSQIRNFEGIQGKHVFQTETSINKGNSGGPLIDRAGQIVGINSNLARRGKDGTAITGVNFAIKSNVVTGWLSSIGYLPKPRVAKAAPGLPSQSEPEGAGIVPVPSEKPKQGKLEDKLRSKKKTTQEPKFSTKPRPYRHKNLFQIVEEEMEDMMEDMKKGTRQEMEDIKTGTRRGK